MRVSHRPTFNIKKYRDQCMPHLQLQLLWLTLLFFTTTLNTNATETNRYANLFLQNNANLPLDSTGGKTLLCAK
jgi:hypothetical protein